MSADTQQSEFCPAFAEVALPIPLRKTFTYSLPDKFIRSAAVGSRVLVPFGKRSLTGFITAFRETPEGSLADTPELIKPVTELIDETPIISEELIALTKWAADFYYASWGEMLKAALPAGINAAAEHFFFPGDTALKALTENAASRAVRWQILKTIIDSPGLSRKTLIAEFGEAAVRNGLNQLVSADHIIVETRTAEAKVKPKLQKYVTLLDNADADDSKTLTHQHSAIIRMLSENGGKLLFTEVLEMADVGASPITTLAKRGFLTITVEEVLRDPLAGHEFSLPQSITLNEDQVKAVGEINAVIENGDYATFLLHGITGSGKTEVYYRAIHAALKKGRSALMLVPEIALTPAFSRQLRDIFGQTAAILHSALGGGERFDEWRRIRSGEARVVIGTRSAIFAPLDNIGVVIIDEEHDASYRQHESPFYNARDLAVYRANLNSAVAILGSATPSLESFHNTQNGKYRYLQMPFRVNERPLATSQLIDMREVFRKAGKDVIISPQLAEAIRETHARGEQSIILLNRRGFSAWVLCRSCGQSLNCKNCDISMTYHKRESRLVCHYCNHNTAVPTVCPFCKSEFLYFMGQGTEQIEEVIAKRFPELKIARVDRDTMKRKGEISKTLFAFDRGDTDMLIGTQMIAKGHDFKNVTLVGVISIDAILGIADFRSAERAFQLLTQVAGRAGRGDLRGRVLIQTYHPEHYALLHSAEQDFSAFASEELRYRRLFDYPPFSVVASLLVKHRDLAQANKQAGFLAESLKRANADRSSRILGPAQAAVSRIKNEYRIQIIIKSKSHKALRMLIDAALEEAAVRGLERRFLELEIDPQRMT